MPISLRQMKNSNRSVRRGSSGLRLVSGDTSTGYIGYEGGLNQLFLDLLVKAGVQRVAPGLFGGIGQLHALGLGGGHCLGVVGYRVKVYAYILLYRVNHGEPRPAGSQVDLLRPATLRYTCPVCALPRPTPRPRLYPSWCGSRRKLRTAPRW